MDLQLWYIRSLWHVHLPSPVVSGCAVLARNWGQDTAGLRFPFLALRTLAYLIYYML